MLEKVIDEKRGIRLKRNELHLSFKSHIEDKERFGRSFLLPKVIAKANRPYVSTKMGEWGVFKTIGNEDLVKFIK